MSPNWERYPYTRIFFGRSKRKEIGEICRGFGKKSLLTTSRGFAKRYGYLEELIAVLEKVGIKTRVFMGIEPEPSEEIVRRLSERIKEEEPDFLIALGGGSVIDATKSAEAMASLKVELKELYGADKVSGALGKAGKSLRPLLALPTTSGSGSEVTKYAVIYDSKERMKMLLADFALCPKVAIVDPELTLSAGLNLTIATGLDALCHLIESYLNPQPGPDWLPEMTEQGIRLILENLPKLKENLSDLSAREKLSLASTSGGIAITIKGTGLPHGFSYSFREILAHGSAVALTLIPSWRYYLPAVEEKTRKLAPIFQLSPELPLDALAEKIFSQLKNFYLLLGHPTSLKELPQIDDQVLQSAVQAVMKNPSKLANAPRPVPLDQAERILTQILKS